MKEPGNSTTQAAIDGLAEYCSSRSTFSCSENAQAAIDGLAEYCSSRSTFSCSENAVRNEFSSGHFDHHKDGKCPRDGLECESSTVKECGSPEERKLICVFVQETRVTSESYSRKVDENGTSTETYSTSKPHKACDIRWEALQFVKSSHGPLGLEHFKVLKKLGGGDIGNVYLAELRDMGCLFALKVMDKEMVSVRGKQMRAKTERDILTMLDHPFLPTLYSHFETAKFSCLLMEFCSGGDLYTQRQRQPDRHFTEPAARFYASEVLLALEYLHMMGVVYRDLKPENVLIRDDGHIMLTDFDLSLRCSVSPTLVQSNSEPSSKISGYCIQPPICIEPACLQPTCFRPRFHTKRRRAKKERGSLSDTESLPVLIAEPTSARSMSIVGTHEYLAPEIIAGSGHGSAVDWWTFGIFLYELLYGRTPFKGNGTRETLFNVSGQPLKFPQASNVSFAAKDLIRGLLVKDPQKRLGYKNGATEIKGHAFFESLNWPLIRTTQPPEIPKPVNFSSLNHTLYKLPSVHTQAKERAVYDGSPDNYLEFDIF